MATIVCRDIETEDRIENAMIVEAVNEYHKEWLEMESYNAPESALDAFTKAHWAEWLKKAIAAQDREAAEVFAEHFKACA